MRHFIRIFSMIFAVTVFLAAGCLTVSAKNPDKVVDNADILTDSEERSLEEYIIDIIEKHDSGYDIVILTEYGINGGITEHTDDYYDYNGYGYGPQHSGIILCIDMQERSYHMSTCGEGITVFTDRGLERLEGSFLDDLGSGDYSGAFRNFASECDTLIGYYEENGRAYDVYSVSDAEMSIKKFMRSITALIVGVIVALAVCLPMRSQLNSARMQVNAGNYIRQGSFRVTGARDLYLYKRVSRTRISSDSSSGSGRSGGSSTHRSSSGRSHGGRSGHF